MNKPQVAQKLKVVYQNICDGLLPYGGFFFLNRQKTKYKTKNHATTGRRALVVVWFFVLYFVF
jgi:hypothetical protein